VYKIVHKIQGRGNRFTVAPKQSGKTPLTFVLGGPVSSDIKSAQI
jgi:hypothetical protein